MAHPFLRWLVPAALCAATAVALAQTAARAARPDPLDAQAGVPALAYVSSLARYRRWSDPERIPWQDANEAVTRIGGWRAYAREAQPPMPAAMPPGHTGHKTP